MGFLRIAMSVGLALALAGCGSKQALRYRYTVEVDDNGQLVSGSSVQEEYCAFNDGFFPWLGGNALRCRTRGEAAFVDLGPKGVLFALLEAERDDNGFARGSLAPYSVFEMGNRDLWDKFGVTAAAFRRMAEKGKTIAVSADKAPTLVRFRNLSDPSTMELVDPLNLPARFGPGVRIRRIMVSLTTDKLTTGIETKLPWLMDWRLGRAVVFDPRVHDHDYYVRGVPYLNMVQHSYFWENIN